MGGGGGAAGATTPLFFGAPPVAGGYDTARPTNSQARDSASFRQPSPQPAACRALPLQSPKLPATPPGTAAVDLQWHQSLLRAQRPLAFSSFTRMPRTVTVTASARVPSDTTPRGKGVESIDLERPVRARKTNRGGGGGGRGGGGGDSSRTHPRTMSAAGVHERALVPTPLPPALPSSARGTSERRSARDGTPRLESEKVMPHI